MDPFSLADRLQTAAASAGASTSVAMAAGSGNAADGTAEQASAGGRVFRFRAGRDRAQRGERRRRLRQRFSYTAALRSAQQPSPAEGAGGSAPSRDASFFSAGEKCERELAWIALWESISNGGEVSADDEAAVLACEKWRRKAQGERHDFWYRLTSHFQQWGRLTAAVRSGVPARLRGGVWYTCSGAATKRRSAGRAFDECLAEGQGMRTAAVAAIDMDVPRTGVAEELLQPLRNVLVAFAARNPEVGYCQSMNFVVAALLLYVSEERAFWMLCSLVEDVLPTDYYTSTMSGLRADLKLLASLVAQYLPSLHAHMADKAIDLAPIAMNWFLCLFVNTLPAEQSHRVLDCILHEGSKVLFRAALGILRARERELLEVDSLADVYLLLRAPFGSDCSLDPWLEDAKLAPAATEDLLSIMYGSWLRGLSTELLQSLRQEHSATVREEDVRQAAQRRARAAAPAPEDAQPAARVTTQELLARAVEMIEQLPSPNGGALGYSRRSVDEPHAAASWLSHVTGDVVDERSKGSSDSSEDASQERGASAQEGRVAQK